MRLSEKLLRFYFNFVYNQVYDFTTAQLSRYRELQERCVRKFNLEDRDRVLCVGLGTGNEISHILKMNRNVNIVGVDYSNAALRKACKKALALGNEIECLVMDARYLEFTDGSFDKVLCVHVMDFIEENDRVTAEILRVLKDGGQFVITYPSDMEGPKLGFNLLMDNVRNNISSKGYFRAFFILAGKIITGPVYLPLILRSKKRSYSNSELETTFAGLRLKDFGIEEDAIYQDFIVYGRK